jgi:phospholipase C
MENRSFDHYLGSLRSLEGRADVDGLTGAETNPDPSNNPVASFLLTDFTVEDPPHGWDACHAQWNNGLNDGFVKAHAGANQNDVMGYHRRDQLKTTYALADAYAICDNYFASVMGPTWPNRFYLHGATSNGQKGNVPVIGFDSVFSSLEGAGFTTKNYFHDIAWASGAYFKLSGNSGVENFFTAAAAGTLPNFSIIDPQFFGNGANDDHPDHDIQLGQALINAVHAALGASPQWNRCLLIITYDEHGGFFDHVPPPTTTDERDEFRQLGFRVPTIVAGPYVRRGCTVNTLLEHSSVVRTLMTKFQIPSPNIRATAASDLSSAIDATTLLNPQPAATLPPIVISLSKVFESEKSRQNHHPELWKMAEDGLIPKHLDRRADSDAITMAWLTHAERLGAVKLIA